MKLKYISTRYRLSMGRVDINLAKTQCLEILDTHNYTYRFLFPTQSADLSFFPLQLLLQSSFA